MKNAWRFHPGAASHSVPVEMRFIDLFMAALGALIFMAMLLAFLLRYLPTNGGNGQHCPEPVISGTAPLVSEPLEIVTRHLPAAHVGEPYEAAFAYRGGTGSVRWKIAAGIAEIPDGMDLDPQRGLLTGTPTARTTARFVLQANAGDDDKDQQPYELVVEASRKKGSRRLELVFAGIVTAVALITWLGSLVAVAQLKERIAILEKAWAQGRDQVNFESGKGDADVIYLPKGLNLYRSRLVTVRRFSRLVLMVLLLLVAWFVWRMWIS